MSDSGQQLVIQGDKIQMIRARQVLSPAMRRMRRLETASQNMPLFQLHIFNSEDAKIIQG